MFNKISNYTKVPNGYIYTSHTGSEYIFLEGAWYNAQSMVEIDSSKNYKMEESALRQINEQNEQSTLQIGKTYIINESEYVYVGKNRVTQAGTVLNESSSILELMEAEEEPVPEGYIYASGKGKQYLKKNGKWISSETKKEVNQSVARSIESAAQRAISKFNQQSPLKIGAVWTSAQGKVYKYVGGNRWMTEDGKMLPQTTGKTITDRMTKSDEEEQEEQSTEQSSEEPVQPVQSEPEPTKPESPKSDEPAGDLESLAEKIKNHPQRRRLTVLITRGGEIPLLAADIILSGKDKDAQEILKSLNNEEN